MPKLFSRPSSGFTVLELLIVLAAAGVIFSIIFSAIPALTRNSRNGQRRQDVAAVLEAISHYQSNNSGTPFPPACATLPNPSGCPTTLLQYAKLTYYDKTTVPSFLTVHADQAGQDPTVGTLANPNGVDIYNFHLCKPGIFGVTGVGATSAGAGYRDIVALYDIDRSSGRSLQCQQL